MKIDYLSSEIWVNMGTNINLTCYEKLNDTKIFIDNFGFIP